VYILGIRNGGYDTSSCLMKDGEILFAICEERLSGDKRTKKFPLKATETCLQKAGITFNDIDHVVIPWNPSINLERLNSNQSSYARYMPEYLYSVPNYLLQLHSEPFPQSFEQVLEFEKSNIHIHYLNHHLCHSAYAAYTSPFDKSYILSIDAWGEKETTMLSYFSDNQFHKVWSLDFPHSMGMYYQALTQFLGFKPQGDEWKVMGAASYGDPNVYKDRISQLITLMGNGTFELNLRYFDFMSFIKPKLYANTMLELLGNPRYPDEELTQRHFDIAAAVQAKYEDTLFHILNHNKIKETDNLCLGGGCAMNCVANGLIESNTPFNNVHIGFSPDDAGTSIGASLLFWHSNLGNSKSVPEKPQSPYLSPPFSDDELETALKAYKLNFTRTKNPAKDAATDIAEGKIVGWFQGSMEFGQRALGNRSILADPRRQETKDLINQAIKYRESFRPFAPAILDEFGDEFFELYETVPYMEKVLYYKAGKGELVPAVCHVDGTGRLQSVIKTVNPMFWELIHEFYLLTGIPLVLNTSFNLNNEPIAHAPKDAIRTFYSCGMDVLFLGPYRINK
jgi:carbamoyltransferase